MTTSMLPAALDALVGVASRAGVATGTARAEGLNLSAAVLEQSAPGAVHRAWGEAVGMPSASFFEHAPRGRRYAGGPTTTLATLVAEGSPHAADYARSLAEVATSACTVPGAGVGAVGKASVAAHAQLAAAGAGAAHPGSPAQGGPAHPGSAAGLTPPSPAGELPAAGAGRHTSGLDLGRGSVDGRDPIPEATLRSSAVLQQLTALQEATRHLFRDRFPFPQLDPPPGTSTGDPDTTAGTTAPAAPRQGTPDAGQPPSPQQASGHRLATQDDPSAPPTEEKEPEPERTVEELLAELDELIGLGSVKREVHRQVALLKMEARREAAGLRAATITRHLVFTGNPGTGKTTVARLVGGIYRALGLLSKGQLVEVDRSELVAGYLGQTAAKTAEVVSSAIGGVLFVDEAYALNGDQYGKEAVDTLVKEMEDHRSDLVVIVAGYPAPMREFVSSNPGLSSRFRTTITFEDYTDEEITQILLLHAGQNDYDVSEEAEQRFREILAATPRDETFGNGRFARNTLEAAIGRHAWRLRDVEEPTLEELRTLERVDLEDREGETVDRPLEQETPAGADAAAGQDAAGPGDGRTGDDDPDQGDDRTGEDLP